MLNIIVSILSMLLTICFIIGVHESGHFFAARLAGVKVLRFSLGFGKALLRWHDKQGTEYVLAAIPLGGYVKMLDEVEGSVPTADLHRAYNRQPFYKKLFIVAAGPAANLIFAFVLYWLLFIVGFTSIVPVIGKVLPSSIAAQAGLQSQQEIVSIDNQPTHSWSSVVIRILFRAGDTGHLIISTRAPKETTVKDYSLDLSHWHMNNLKPDPFDSLGLIPYEPEVPAIIGKILPTGPAAKSSLQKGDTILAFGNKPIKNWQDFSTIIDTHAGKTLPVTVKRQGKIHKFSLTIDSQSSMSSKKHGFLGVTPAFEWPKNLLHVNQYSPTAALGRAWQNTYDFTYMNFLIFGKLITGKVSLQSLGGPISIFQSAGTALNQGIMPFVSYLAFISIAIGVVNILPIPGLDGGHVLFQLIELILRRPLSLPMQMLMYRVGLVIIFLLIFQAIINDILRL